MVVRNGVPFSVSINKSHTPQHKRSVSHRGRALCRAPRQEDNMTAVIITALICATLLGLVWLSK